MSLLGGGVNETVLGRSEARSDGRGGGELLPEKSGYGGSNRYAAARNAVIRYINNRTDGRANGESENGREKSAWSRRIKLALA